MPDRTTVAAPVSEVLATSMVGLLVGAGEVAGQPQDDRRRARCRAGRADGGQDARVLAGDARRVVARVDVGERR